MNSSALVTHVVEVCNAQRRDTSTTSIAERTLLLCIVVAMPLEYHLEIVPNFSVIWLLFGVATGYVLLCRLWSLMKTLKSPVFIAAYVFLCVGLLLELTQPHADIYEVSRIGQMIFGGILIASLCRDQASLQAAIYGYLIAGIWLSVLLFGTSYTVLQTAAPTDFQEASELRTTTFAENPLTGDLNKMAFVSAQGTVVALASALFTRSGLWRGLYLGSGLFCLVASFLPLSRSGAVIGIASCLSVMYAFGLKRGESVAAAGLVVGALLVLVPDSVWTRMAFSTEAHDGKLEGRAFVYSTAIDNFTDYAISGVGAGNFWNHWGMRKFTKDGRNVAGTHNCFFQVALYWGIGGLTTLLFVVWNAYRSLPRACGRDSSSLCLLGLSVSLLIFSLTAHTLYAKEFSIGFGLLAAARLWIWPTGIVQRRTQ